MFEGLALLTLPTAIKTALELADRRLQKQMEKVEKSRSPDKKGKKDRHGEEEEDIHSPTSFQAPTVSKLQYFLFLFILLFSSLHLSSSSSFFPQIFHVSSVHYPFR